MTDAAQVTEMRLVVTTDDYERALHFYRDLLGLREVAAFTADGGHVTILEAGRATLELADPVHAAYVDRVEVDHRVAGHIRVAFGVDDATVATERLRQAGTEVIAPPIVTPWGSSNARIAGAAGLQLTLFSGDDV